MARYFNSLNANFLNKLAALVTGYPVTFAMWVNPVNFGATSNILTISNSSSSALDSFTTQLGGSGLSKPITEANQGPSTSVDTAHGTSLVTGTWAHVCSVFTDATHRFIYLNGVQAGGTVGSATPGASNALSYTVIGKHPQVTTVFCRDWIAFPAVWAIDLAQSEVTSLAQGLHPRKIRPDKIKACLPLSGDVTIAVDLVAGAWTVNGTATDEPNPPIYGINK